MTPQSRRRDRRAIWTACALMQLLPVAALISAHEAKADPTDNYAAINAAPICATLDNYPTIAGVTGVLSGVMADSGFTAYEAGQVVATAVIGWCPRHLPVLKQFVAVYSEAPSQTYVASGRVGGVIR